jgi:hypothetical protein
MIRIDETLPWIELKGKYATRAEAREAAQKTLEKIAVRIVTVSQERNLLKTLVAVRATR